VDQIDTVQHLCAAGSGEGLTDTEELLVLSRRDSACCPFFLSKGCQTHHLLVDPLEFLDKLVVKLKQLSVNCLTDRVRFRERHTILKCTGGPPNEVKPRYQVWRTVFQSLGLRFHSDMESQPQLLGDKRCLTPILACRVET
jgi:hypothetical protein